MQPRAVEWKSGQDSIIGRLYEPEGSGPFPGVVLCHGFAGVKELLLPAYANRFAAAGLTALTFDYRGFGESGGERGRLVPDRQIEDIRGAIEFLVRQPKVSGDRVALWGTSLGGANAIVAALGNPHVKCLAAQLTFADGERVVTGKMSSEEKEKFLSSLKRMSDRRARTGKETMVPLGDVLTDPQSAAFYERYSKDFPALDIEIPLLTVAETIKLKPEQILPTLAIPLLVIGAGKDSVNPPEESRLLFEAANEPKSLLMLDEATHYELYEGALLETASKRQIDWFQRYL